MYSLTEECRMNAEYQAECQRRYAMHAELLQMLELALLFIDARTGIQRVTLQDQIRSVIAKAQRTRPRKNRNGMPPRKESIYGSYTSIVASVELEKMLTDLDRTFVPLEEFGCLVALPADRSSIFVCPMNVDGSPDRDHSPHMNWSEVTALDPEFLNKVNELFGTSFDHASFAGR